jgi:hypothetical protein
MSGTHTEHENDPWTIDVVDHPPRKDSPEYVASRKLMHKIIAEVDDWILGPGPYQDHHGGAVWVKDDDGWLLTQLPLGIEWSAQFCADPAKIDKLRVMAGRIVRAFPATLPTYEALGYTAGKQLLATEITTPDDIARWTDSIFNASMPVPAAVHTGKLPKGAGYHHYPKPIVDIDHFRRDDFHLFVTDQQGLPAVVVPASADPNDGQVWLLGANHGSDYARLLASHPETSPAERIPGLAIQDMEPDFAPEPGQPTFSGEIDHPALLPATDYLAQQAFAGPQSH